jgi:hypothetical protein
MKIRHNTLRDCGLSALGQSFRVDSEGLLVPDPDDTVGGTLLRLAGYERVAEPTPEAKPEPTPAPKKKKTTTRRRKTASKE